MTVLDLSEPSAAADSKPSRMPKVVASFLRLPRVGTWSGLAVIAAGIILITVAWADVAGTEEVGDQLPYVMSGGFVGLALVCIGATLAAIDAKLNDAKARKEQNLELLDALADLRAVDEAAL